VLTLLLAFCAVQTSAAQGTHQAMQQDPACQVLTPASTGGPLPKDPSTAVIRWLGHTNYELVYQGNVFLLDAYYERVPRSHPIGVVARDFTRATALFVGHPHFDHMSDAATVAKQTGTTVIAAAAAGEVLTKGGLPARQFKAVKGGEMLQYPQVTVQAVLGHHNVIATTVPAGFLDKQEAALQVAALQEPYSDAEAKQAEGLRARGSRDPSIATTGVINYLFTLGNDFRVMFADSPGPVTDAQRAVMQQLAGVDVAMLPYVSFEAGIPPLLELVKTFKPATLFLGHHDGAGTMLWASNYPPANAIRRASPGTRTLDVLYRTPVCFNTTTKEVVIGW
jgi:L-ascorbate metabolism protein UlaG (beta-lactamase superfamily)